jgi:ABC-2 type transport system permease protein
MYLNMKFKRIKKGLGQFHAPLRINQIIEVAYILSWKNIKVRYKSSVLGIVWSLATPLIFLLIFVFIFDQAFSEIENYPLFALSGLIFWNFFSTATSQIIGSVVEAAGILKSIPVPPILFPLSSLMAAVFNLMISLIPFSILMVAFGNTPNLNSFLLIPIVFLYSCFILGLSMTMAALNVYLRDIGMLWSSLLPAILYLTPIAYPITLIPEKWRWLMNFNPLFHYINATRSVLYDSTAPSISDFLIMTGLSVLSLAFGIAIFKKVEGNFISAI